MLTPMPTDRTLVNQQAAELLSRWRDESLSEMECRQAGDAFFALFYRLALKRIRLYTLVSPDNQADIAQEAAHALCQARDLWEPARGDFSTILEYVLRRQMRDYNRKRSLISRSRSEYRACPEQPEFLSLENERLETATSERFEDSIERRVLVRQALARLAERERKVTECSFGFEDGINRTNKEVAAELGMPLTTCNYLLQRAKGKLRNLLQDLAP